MSSHTTIARPYAKAAFTEALAENKLERWEKFLSQLSVCVEVKEMQSLLGDPNVSKEQLFELISFICRKVLYDNHKNFLQLLIANHRLNVVPEIYALFVQLRESHEQRLTVEVITALPIERGHRKQFTSILSNLLQRQVELVCHEDQSLIGGAIIRAADRVIDGSVRGKLRRMSEKLISEG